MSGPHARRVALVAISGGTLACGSPQPGQVADPANAGEQPQVGSEASSTGDDGSGPAVEETETRSSPPSSPSSSTAPEHGGTTVGGTTGSGARPGSTSRDATGSSSGSDVEGSSTADASTGASTGATTIDDPLVELSDEFDDPAYSAETWTFRHEAEGVDAQFQSFTFDDGQGRARMVPDAGGWFDAFGGPYLYQLVEGDFMMEAHVVAHRVGDPTLPPTQPYNSAGLLVRNVPVTGEERWVLHHLGMHDPTAAGVGIERKLTIASSSELVLTANTFRGRLRICRVGDEVMLTRRLDDESSFSMSAQYTIELDEVVEAGFSLTAWNTLTTQPDLSVEGDVEGVWDYVRYESIDALSACLEE